MFSFNFDLTRMALDSALFETYNFVSKKPKSYPYDVITRREGDKIIIMTEGFKKEVRMRNNWFGKRWTTRMKDAQREAFMLSYQRVKEMNILGIELDIEQ